MYYEELLEELGLNAKSMAKPSCVDKYQIFKAIRIKEITVRSIFLFLCYFHLFLLFTYSATLQNVIYLLVILLITRWVIYTSSTPCMVTLLIGYDQIATIILVI